MDIFVFSHVIFRNNSKRISRIKQSFFIKYIHIYFVFFCVFFLAGGQISFLCHNKCLRLSNNKRFDNKCMFSAAQGRNISKLRFNNYYMLLSPSTRFSYNLVEIWIFNIYLEIFRCKIKAFLNYFLILLIHITYIILINRTSHQICTSKHISDNSHIYFWFFCCFFSIYLFYKHIFFLLIFINLV